MRLTENDALLYTSRAMRSFVNRAGQRLERDPSIYNITPVIYYIDRQLDVLSRMNSNRKHARRIAASLRRAGLLVANAEEKLGIQFWTR